MNEELNKYVWGKSGTADSEVKHLETLLSELRYTRQEPVFLQSLPKLQFSPWWKQVVDWVLIAPRLRYPRFAIATAASILVVALSVGLIRNHFSWQPNRPWAITAVEGSPRLENAEPGSLHTLAV